MASLTAATAGRLKTAPAAGFPGGALTSVRRRGSTSATASGHSPEAKWGSLGAGLLQRELTMSTRGAVAPGTAAVGMP